MENIIGTKEQNRILLQLFQKAEKSYTVSDIAKALGPMIDLIFISQFIGINGVTVISYIGPLIMLFELFGTAISSGARNKVSSLIGAGKMEEANQAFSGSIIMGAVLTVATAILVWLLRAIVATLLGAKDPEAFVMTQQYICGYLIGFPFFTLIRILTPYLQMEGQYRMVTVTSILTTVVDVTADALVIFVFKGGMFEIGLATSVGYIIPFVIMASFFIRKKRSAFHLSLKGVRIKQCAEILRLGAPSGIVKGSNALGGMLINNMLTGLQMPYLVAAYGVFSQITVYVRSAWYAPADTLHAFAGVFIGEEDRETLKETQRISLLHAILYTCIVTAALFLLAPILVGFFLKAKDPEAQRLGIECVRVACFALPFHSIVYNFNNYLMSVKRITFCSIYSFLIECGVLVPVTFISIHLMGYHGSWAAKVFTMAILSVIAVCYILIKGNGSSFREKALLLPDSFGVPEENEIAIIATTTEEIVDLSRIATVFAMEHGAEKSRAQTVGLITEELASFLAKNGFSDDKPHNINARLVAKDEKFIIRMRDDCKLLNVKEYYEELQKDNVLHNEISLAIILRMAKDVQYTEAFGVNNLIVTI